MASSERHSVRVGLSGDRDDDRKSLTDDRERGFDFRPATPPLLVRDIGEFVQNLRANEAAFRKDVQRLAALVDVKKSIDENIRVEEAA